MSFPLNTTSVEMIRVFHYGGAEGVEQTTRRPRPLSLLDLDKAQISSITFPKAETDGLIGHAPSVSCHLKAFGKVGQDLSNVQSLR